MIIRSKHDKRHPYLTISMKILRDRRLSSEERDCLIMMLSNSDNWEFSYKGLATQLGLKRETVKARVQSLIEKGYVSVSYPTGENGKPLPFAKGDWEIREEPLHSVRSLDTSEQALQCPVSGHQPLDTSHWTPATGHQALDTSERTQRTTEGTNGVLLPKEYQIKEYQGENHHLLQKQVEVEEDVSPTPYSGNSSWESSSEANASPLSSKTPTPSTQESGVMSQREFEFQQFLKKYPKSPLVREMEETRKAFFEATALDGSYAEIMAGLDAWCRSSEWSKDGGRWIKKPLNWLKEHQWEKAKDSQSWVDRLDELFPDEEDEL